MVLLVKNVDIIQEAKDNQKKYADFFRDFLIEARDDNRFECGDQWKDEDKAKRNGRPMEVINDAKITLRRTIEDYDQKRSTIKVKGSNNNTDKITAEAFQGLIYQIHNDSLGEAVKDLAMEEMLRCGFGAYKWETEYENNLSFNQVIKLKPCYNAIDNVYLDITNQKQIDGTDVMWGGENFYYSPAEFEARWPEATPKGFPDLGDGHNDGFICVSRYERIELRNDTLVSIANPFTGQPLVLYVSDFKKNEYRPILNYFVEQGYKEDKDVFAWLNETNRVLADRDVERRSVKWYLLTCDEILEEGETGGEFIPIIPMLGPRYILNGRVYFDSLIRQTKDPARLSNFVISNYVEAMSADTIAPWVTNFKKIKNHMKTWAQANNRPVTALPYDEVELGDGTIDNSPPIKTKKGDVPAGWAQLFQFTNDTKQRTSGLPDSALGLQGNEVSGSALDLRTNNSLSNRSIFFKKRHFSDQLLGKQFEKAIPVYYGSERLVSVANIEGKSKDAMINKENHDQGEGQYKGKNIDIKNAQVRTFITIGPSFSSLRQETTAKLGEIMQYAGERYNDVVFPELVKYSDIADSGELYENCMKVAPVEIQDQEEKDAKQLQAELAKKDQEIQALQQQNQQMEKVIMGEEQKVQSQKEIAQLKSETDLRKEIIKQEAETRREGMSNQTDIKTTEIDAQAEINVQMLKMMEQLNAKIDSITTIRT